MSTPAPLLELRAAAFGYRGRSVVAGIELALAPGQCLAVLGPNGAGKTTLLRGLLGLLAPLAGSVQRRGAQAFVPQREGLDALYPLNALEVVEMGLYGRLRGWRRLAAHEREQARACLAQVGLEQHARAAFSGLSGGQRQRVLIARALATRAELLVLDEPTHALDEESRRETSALLLRIQHERGGALVIASHDPAQLADFRPACLWVADGRARACTLEQVLAARELRGAGAVDPALGGDARASAAAARGCEDADEPRRRAAREERG